jgi:ABC-type transport system involved in cytochrome bd biosynthesis fused ATPase/permease subunit
MVLFLRPQDIMLEDETSGTADNINNNNSATTNGQNHPKNNVTSDTSVNVVNASARWSPDLEKDSLSNITFRVPEGKLCAVIGPVGSGKVRIILLHDSKHGHRRRLGPPVGGKTSAIPQRERIGLKIFTVV